MIFELQNWVQAGRTVALYHDCRRTAIRNGYDGKVVIDGLQTGVN